MKGLTETEDQATRKEVVLRIYRRATAVVKSARLQERFSAGRHKWFAEYTHQELDIIYDCSIAEIYGDHRKYPFWDM